MKMFLRLLVIKLNIKRVEIISILIILYLLMLSGCANQPKEVEGREEYYYSGEYEGNYIYELDENNNAIICGYGGKYDSKVPENIPMKLDGKDVVELGYLFSGAIVDEVDIPEGIEMLTGTFYYSFVKKLAFQTA